MILQSDSQCQWYPLHFAASKGHIKIVRFLVEEKQCDPMCKTKDGETPLHLSSQNGHLEVVKYLTEDIKCDPMCLDKDNWSPLHFAALNGQIEIVRFLVEEKRCDPTCRTKDGETPLHLSSHNGHLEVVKYLTEDTKCDPMCLDKDNRSPLHFAALNGQIEIVRFLIEEKQCDPMCRTKDGETPLHLSSESNTTPLHLAALSGQTEVVKYFVEEKQCDPMCSNKDEITPLHIASRNGHLELVKYLTEDIKCDSMCKTKKGRTPLHLSSQNGHLEVVMYLTEDIKCDPMCLDYNYWCSLHFAASEGHIKIVRYFVEEKQCYPMCRTRTGKAPLHLCCDNGHLQVVKYLTADKKCNPMIRQCDSHHQWYPVHSAASKGHIQIVRFLIEEKECDPVCVAKNDWTPLHLASQNGHLEVVKYLVHHGSVPLQYSAYRVNPNLIPEFSSIYRKNATITPLQLACMKGHFDVVHFLLSDTDLSLMCQDISCLHMAAVCGQLDIIEILLNTLEGSRDTELQQWAGITALNLAAFMGQQSVVARLLTFLENQYIPINSGQNALHVTLMGLTFRNIVSTQEFSDMLKLFLKLLSFADVTSIDSELLTKYYCKGSNIEVVKTFLTTPHYFRLPSEDIIRGITLHAACFLGQTEAVKLIIQTDCIQPMITDNEGLSPFHYTVLGRIFREVSARNDYDAHIQLEAVRDYLENRCELKNIAVDDIINKCFNLLMRHFRSQDYLEVCDLLVKEYYCDPLASSDKDGETPLHYAAWFNDAESFKFLAKASAQNPLCPNNHGVTSLHIASGSGNAAIVKFLVDCYRDQPLCRCKDGTTPLHWASETGQIDIIEILTSQAPFNFFTEDINGRSPLHYAAASNQLRVLQYFIDQLNCDPLCKDRNENTVLHYAALHGFFPIMEYLLTTVTQNAMVINNSGYTPLHLAALKGHLKVVQLLANYPASTNSLASVSGETVLHAATRGGHIKVVMFLVGECQSNPMSRDMNGNTPLHIAASNGYKKIVMYLAWQKGSDVNCTTTSGSTALHDACTCGHLDIVEFLVDDQNCNPLRANSIGATPLHLAVAHGHADIVKFLCNLKNYNHFCSTPCMYWTPLHLACNIKSDNLAKMMVQILLNQASSDLLSRYKGVSPLHLASHSGLINVIKFLIIEAKCDPLQPDDSDRIALHYAVENQKTDVIDYLLSCKPDSVFHSDLRGVTPIMCATSEDILVKLLLKGADPSDIKIELPDKLTYLNSDNYVCLTGRNIVNVVGNARSGKSTLIKALESEHKGFLKGWTKVTIAIPAEVGGIASSMYDKSKHFGPVVFRDFTGEAENYCCHSLSSEGCKSFAKSIFIIAVKLTDPLDDIKKQVSYWLHWVSNLCIAMESGHSSVIIVGSHRDKLKAQELKAKYLYFQKLERDIQSCWLYITLVGFAILNCQQCRSTEMLNLKNLLQTACMKPNITNTHSMLVAFINCKYGDRSPIQLSTLLHHLTENDIPLPQSLEDLHKLCQDLDSSGHVALLTNENAPEQSWIICNQQTVFQLANAFLRDAKEHSQYKFSGVVPFSELLAWFGDAYNPNFIQQYLVRVQICQPIKDPQILSKLSPSEEYYFFPALLETTPCQELWKPDLKYEHYFGWSIQTKTLHFLPTQFLHTLLLRFAARFGSTFPDNRSERNFGGDEYCMMWKNGIRWIHIQSGTEAVAQICEQSTVATIIMRCIKGYEMKCYKHRAEVLKMATDIAEEFHLMEIIREYILHPQSIFRYQHLHPQPLRHLKRYHIQRVVDAIMLETNLIVEERDEQSRMQVALPPEFERIEVLLHFEPFLGLRKEVTTEIFDSTVHREWKTGNDLSNMLKPSSKITTDQSDKYVLILQDLMEKGGTVGELFHRLQEYSIFQGRKCLEKASTQPYESENKYAHASALSSNNQLEIEVPRPSDISSDTPHRVHATHFQLNEQPLKPVWKLADDSRLEIAALQDLISELIDITNWRTLGQALGLHNSTLEKIEAVNKGQSDDCMRDMLSAWLQCKDDVKQFGVPSWQILAKALLLPAMSEVALACQIVTTYTLHNLDSSLDQSRAPSPQDFPLTTHEMGILMNILQPVAAKWQDLGLQLGVPIGELRNIACTPANAACGPTACLRDMLTKWLQTTSTPHLTSLSVALRCDSVQEKRLADELKEKYLAYKKIDQQQI